MECPRQQDVFDAIASRRWPHRVDGQLRIHVAACSLCTDLAEVVAALQQEQEATWEDAVALPSADVIWWRAQMRARSEAARHANRPMAIVHALSAACFAGAAATVLGVAGPWLKSVWTALAGWQVDLNLLDPAGVVSRGILLAVVVWLVLAPIAVYLVTPED